MATASNRTVRDAQARVSQEAERLKRQGREGQFAVGPDWAIHSDLSAVKSGLTPVKLYLVAYNLVSAALWGYVLVLTVAHFLEEPTVGEKVSNFVKFFAGPSSLLPDPIKHFVTRLSGAYDYKHLGAITKWTQTLAALEVVHAATGLVRSPVGTTAMQVASRLWTVWGVVEAKPAVRGASHMLEASH